MNFIETKLKGSFILELDKIKDERGFFATTWEKDGFAKNGINFEVIQSNLSFNHKKGTIRGMHFQINNFQDKLVRCTKGKIYDVFVDLRPESKTFKKWFSIQLTSDNYKMIYVPEGLAHGFQSLADEVKIFYQVYLGRFKLGLSKGNC